MKEARLMFSMTARLVLLMMGYIFLLVLNWPNLMNVVPLMAPLALAPFLWAWWAGRGAASAPASIEDAISRSSAPVAPFLLAAAVGTAGISGMAWLLGLRGTEFWAVAGVALVIELSFSLLLCRPLLQTKRSIWAYKAFVTEAGGDPESANRKTTLNMMLMFWRPLWPAEVRSSHEAWDETRGLIERSIPAPAEDKADLLRAAYRAEPSV